MIERARTKENPSSLINLNIYGISLPIYGILVGVPIWEKNWVSTPREATKPLRFHSRGEKDSPGETRSHQENIKTAKKTTSVTDTNEPLYVPVFFIGSLSVNVFLPEIVFTRDRKNPTPDITKRTTRVTKEAIT